MRGADLHLGRRRHLRLGRQRPRHQRRPTRSGRGSLRTRPSARFRTSAGATKTGCCSPIRSMRRSTIVVELRGLDPTRTDELPASWIMEHTLAQAGEDQIVSFASKGGDLYAALTTATSCTRSFTTPGADDGRVHGLLQDAAADIGEADRPERMRVYGKAAAGGTSTKELRTYKDWQPRSTRLRLDFGLRVGRRRRGRRLPLARPRRSASVRVPHLWRHRHRGTRPAAHRPDRVGALDGGCLPAARPCAGRRSRSAGCSRRSCARPRGSSAGRGTARRRSHRSGGRTAAGRVWWRSPSSRNSSTTTPIRSSGGSVRTVSRAASTPKPKRRGEDATRHQYGLGQAGAQTRSASARSWRRQGQGTEGATRILERGELFYSGPAVSARPICSAACSGAKPAPRANTGRPRAGSRSALRDALLGAKQRDIEGEEAAAGRRQQQLGELDVRPKPPSFRRCAAPTSSPGLRRI